MCVQSVWHCVALHFFLLLLLLWKTGVGSGLPGHIHCHILEGGAGQHSDELVQDGGKEVDHHVTLHGVETLRDGEGERVSLKPLCVTFRE